MESQILYDGNEYYIFTDKNAKKTNIGIQNKSKNNNLTFHFTTKKGFGITTDNTLQPNVWRTVTNVARENLYITVFNDFKIDILSLEYKHDEEIVTKINKTIDFDYNNVMTFFCGHEGGGTSIVVKMLRYLGIHFGDDAGPITNRKAHESISITSIITHIDDNTPTHECRSLFNQIWNIYNYKDKNINCFKRPDILGKTIKLGEVFPNCKIVSIMRKPNGFFSKAEGKRFNEKSELDLMYYQRPLVEGTPMFHLDFNKFFTDYSYVNKLLKFLGSDNFLNNEQELEQLKDKINFDNRVLQ